MYKWSPSQDILHDFKRLDFPPLSFQKRIVDKEAFHPERSAWAFCPGNVFPGWFYRYCKQS